MNKTDEEIPISLIRGGMFYWAQEKIGLIRPHQWNLGKTNHFGHRSCLDPACHFHGNARRKKSTRLAHGLPRLCPRLPRHFPVTDGADWNGASLSGNEPVFSGR
jgi:hypothetical protein